MDFLRGSIEKGCSSGSNGWCPGRDAAYLELAKRKGLPLATLDDNLQEAAIAAGVTVL